MPMDGVKQTTPNRCERCGRTISHEPLREGQEARYCGFCADRLGIAADGSQLSKAVSFRHKSVAPSAPSEGASKT